MTTQQVPQRITVDARQVFPVLKNMKNPLPLDAYDRPWTEFAIRSPQVKPDYVWDEQFLKTLISFVKFGGATSIALQGHTGTGKTEAVIQFHAALNMPLFCISGENETKAYELIGQKQPASDRWVWQSRENETFPVGTATSLPCAEPFPAPAPLSDKGEWARVKGEGFEWVDGPVLMAARKGLPALIDEYNAIDPGQTVGLNALLEGRPYTVPATGEMLVPQPGFRVFATENPKSLGYTARFNQDITNKDRFAITLKVDYPPAAVEKQIIVDLLTKTYGRPAQLASEIADVVVKGAVKVREAFMGENDGANALPCTMSRRKTLEWARWTVIGSGLVTGASDRNAPLYHALDLVLGNQLERTDREALRNIIELATGVPAPADVGA